MSEFQQSVATYCKRFKVENSNFIEEPPSPNLKFIIVVPAFREHEIAFLKQLDQCTAPTKVFELIIVANDHEDNEVSNHFIQKTQQQIEQLAIRNIRIHLIKKFVFNAKKHGVGLARKLGMDEAAKRFNSVDQNGWIVCLDADCFIANDYFQILENQLNDSFESATLNFEHPITGLNNQQHSGIVNYELFLRYYKECLEWIGFPHFYHTIGSSMAVRAGTYAKVGGMNQRKAGEDFYFMHKVFPMGKVKEINSPIVFPSARTSTRVPFGTGRAMLNWQEKNSDVYPTYPFEIFGILKTFLSNAPKWYASYDPVSGPLESFLKDFEFENKLKTIRLKSATKESFIKNFYQLINGFTILKMVHFLRDEQFGEISIELASKSLLNELGIDSGNTPLELLNQYRDLQTSR